MRQYVGLRGRSSRCSTVERVERPVDPKFVDAPRNENANVPPMPQAAERYAMVCTRVSDSKSALGIKRPRWTSKQKSKQKPTVAAPSWFDRFHVTGSKDNKRMPKLRRSYFDSLPWTQVCEGEYQENSGQHGCPNFDVFCATSPHDQACELRKRFRRHPFELASWTRRVSAAAISGLAMEQELQDAPEEAQPEVDEITYWTSLSPKSQRVPLKYVLAAVGNEGEDNGDAASAHEASEATDDLPAGPAPGSFEAICGRPITEDDRALWEKVSPTAGFQAFKQFFEWCTSKFGSLARFWGKIDKKKVLKLTRFEFLRGLRDLQYHGDGRFLISILDRDHAQMLTYYHFDPTGAQELAEVRRWAEREFGSALSAFQALDTDRSGKLTPNEFHKAAREAGFSKSSAISLLFHLLDQDGDKVLTPQELAFVDEWNCPEWLLVDRDPQVAEEFVESLIEKSDGNGIIAWRKLDSACRVRINWNDFSIACRRLGINIEKVAIIWRSLDENRSGWLSLREFDSDASEIIAAFVDYCASTTGSVMKTFTKLDSNASGSMNRNEFRAAASNCGFIEDGERKAELLFNGLDMNGNGKISVQEVRLLESWMMTKDHQEEELWSSLSFFACRRQLMPAMRNSIHPVMMRNMKVL